MKSLGILLLVALMIFFGCKQPGKNSNVYIDRFYKNEEKLNNLREELMRDTFLENKWGELIEKNKFNNTIKQSLSNLNIDSVYLFSWGHHQKQFDFITSWSYDYPIHLYYNTLDTVQTVKGFHKKDEYSNETWGVGNHWSISIVRKYIETLQ